MKKTLLGTLAILTTVGLYAQPNKVTSTHNYLKYGELDKAKEAIDDATVHEKTMNSAKTFLYRGEVYASIAVSTDDNFSSLKAGASLEALNAYKKAQELAETDKKVDKAKINLGYLTSIDLVFQEGVNYFNAKDFANASRYFELASDARSSALNAIDTAGYYNAGLAAERAENEAKAIEMYEKIIHTGYNEGILFSELARLYVKQGDTEKAMATLEKGRSSFPNDQALITSQINLYLQTGKDAEALKNLDDAIKNDPKNAVLYYVRGVLKAKQDNEEGAELDYAKSFELDNTYFDAIYNLGAIYVNKSGAIQEKMNALDFNEQKKYDALKKERDEYFNKAIPALETALSIKNDDIVVIQTLMQLYGKVGKTDKYNEMKKMLDASKK
jgi:tetratricopeptide (TPR) repeat protein